MIIKIMNIINIIKSKELYQLIIFLINIYYKKANYFLYSVEFIYEQKK